MPEMVLGKKKRAPQVRTPKTKTKKMRLYRSLGAQQDINNNTTAVHLRASVRAGFRWDNQDVR